MQATLHLQSLGIEIASSVATPSSFSASSRLRAPWRRCVSGSFGARTDLETIHGILHLLAPTREDIMAHGRCGAALSQLTSKVSESKNLEPQNGVLKAFRATSRRNAPVTMTPHGTQERVDIASEV